MSNRFTGLWKDREFLKYWSASAISDVGSQVTALALPLIGALTLGASAWEMGVLTAAGTLPILVVGLFAGVIVDRLPFASPNDPIVAARVEKLKKEGKEHFYSYQVPSAVLALKQGLGRLIRTRSDRGILCILDLRILTKRYGKIFRDSLYGSPLRRSPEDIEAFFAPPADSPATHGQEQA